ncbi:MAG: hypothetical protein II567_07350, partial [Candidatus Riflebacteria bacterium]|nr:hypothetical protein [Candidatus Riflebacteria bacterium]
DSKLKKTEFVMDGASLCKKVDNNKNISYKSNNRWGMKLRETKANIDKGLDRTQIVKQSEPPNPNDPRMVEGSLKWVDELKVVWRADLKRGTQSIWTKTIPVENFNLTQSQLRELMPMPSDPLRYEINASVYRPYTYMVYVKIPIRREGSEWIYKEERVPVIVTVSIDAEAEVCVTDNIGPSLYQYNAEEGAEVRIVPGYKMIYADKTGKEDKGTVFLKASTGETLDKWNPGKYLIFYVCDNNPMANYDGTVVVSNGTKDKYHLKSDTKALKTSFVQNDKISRQATFHYDTAKGIMPTNDKKSEYTYTLNTTIKPEVVTDETELKSVGLVPSKALSYLKYKIPVTVMKDFSDIKDIDHARLPFDYANNTSGYTNYKFGLSWQERCNASYNVLNNETEVTGSDKEKYFVGTIVIKDNDRPNIFISAFQDRYPDMVNQFRVPTIVVDKKYNNWFEADPKNGFVTTKNTSQWFLAVDDENNGSNDWYIKNTFGGNIKDSFKFLKAKEALLTIFRENMNDEKTNKTKDCRLLTDVPVLFRFVMIDNSGTPKCKSFTLNKYPTGRLADGKTDEAIQYVFRNAGKYYVELEVEDDAKDWPDNSNAIKNPTNAKDEHQTRTLRAYFDVLDSKFDYRVLERGVNEK